MTASGGYTEPQRVYDELLLTLARGGDRRAAERLVARWYPRIRRTARRLIGAGSDTEDVVQDTMAAIAAGWIKVDDPARFPAWAFRILHRKCADQLRKTYTDRALIDPEAQGDQPDQTSSSGVDRLALSDAFGQLPPDQRTAAILYFAEGLSLAELAAVTNIPVGTAKSRLFHARRALKAALTEGGSDDRL